MANPGSGPIVMHGSDLSAGRGDVEVVVVGAGLAGLAAAATARRAGARVTVLDSRDSGGRARVTATPLPGGGAALFNGGPRGLNRTGHGIAVLADLGIRPTGRRAPVRGVSLFVGERLERLPGGPLPWVRTQTAGSIDRIALARLFARVMGGRVRPGRPDESAAAWIAAVAERASLVAPLAAVVRLATYASDMHALSADAACAQLRALRSGVVYLDGGWGQLVDRLTGVLASDGVIVRTHERVLRVTPESDGPAVVTTSGVIRPTAVVVATGGPTAAAHLLGLDDPWSDRLGPASTAACLELAVTRRPRPRFALGIDTPLYLSEHAPPAQLAPDGVRVVHVMRYGARAATLDRFDCEALARRVGLTPDTVIAQRFLARMVSVSAVPTARGGGMAGRPDIGASGQPGVFLAGDWVGPHGYLADAALASGARAGAAAARQAYVRPVGALVRAG